MWGSAEELLDQFERLRALIEERATYEAAPVADARLKAKTDEASAALELFHGKRRWLLIFDPDFVRFPREKVHSARNKGLRPWRVREKQLIEAVGYMRTSSSTNVGADKDSEKRQRAAIEAYAKSAGFKIVDWFYDAAVKGADAITARPGFAAMLDRIAGNGVRTYDHR